MLKPVMPLPAWLIVAMCVKENPPVVSTVDVEVPLNAPEKLPRLARFAVLNRELKDATPLVEPVTELVAVILGPSGLVVWKVSVSEIVKVPPFREVALNDTRFNIAGPVNAGLFERPAVKLKIHEPKVPNHVTEPAR